MCFHEWKIKLRIRISSNAEAYHVVIIAQIPCKRNDGPSVAVVVINVRDTIGISVALSLYTWWRDQIETYSALLAICGGNSPVPGEFPAQGPVTRSFDVFFYLHLNKRLSKQSWGWWFETLSRLLWRHCIKCWYRPRASIHWGDGCLTVRLR